MLTRSTKAFLPTQCAYAQAQLCAVINTTTKEQIPAKSPVTAAIFQQHTEVLPIRGKLVKIIRHTNCANNFCVNMHTAEWMRANCFESKH